LIPPLRDSLIVGFGDEGFAIRDEGLCLCQNAKVVSILRREREVVRRFREAGATTAAAARDLDELHVRPGSGLHRLRQRAVIREAAAEHFYLDEEVWEALGRTRRRVSIAVLCLIVLLIIAVVAVRRLYAL